MSIICVCVGERERIFRCPTTLEDVGILILMSPKDYWQNSTNFFGNGSFFTMKIDNFIISYLFPLFGPLVFCVPLIWSPA